MNAVLAIIAGSIKCCQRTKFGKVIKLARSSIFKWARICAHRAGVKLLTEFHFSFKIQMQFF